MDMDFLTNCVSLDESVFHVNTKQTRANKGTTTAVTVPTTRAKTTTILGTISASSLIEVSFRIPKPTKKRKTGQEFGYLSTSAVTRYYVSFLRDTLDEMDIYPQMKGHHLIMDNALINKPENIIKYITYRDIDVLIYLNVLQS